MSVERRHARRHARRLAVKFWQQGREQQFDGYTTDVSASGIFIATRHTLPVGTRIKIEVSEGEQSFVLEGMVLHVRMVPTERGVKLVGLAARFLQIAELIRELLPGPMQAWSDAVDRGVYGVEFKNGSHFLDVFQREIQFGGMFVRTVSPADVGQLVTLELCVPAGVGGGRHRFVSRVVYRVEADSNHEAGKNLIAGVGVEFPDLGAVVEVLRPAVERSIASMS